MGKLPVVSAPGFVVPENACDCHCHVFGPYAEYPLAAEHTYQPPEATAQSYLSVLDTLGFQRAVLVQASVHGLDNRAMLHALDIGGDRLRGVAVVDAKTTAQQLQQLYDRGVRGLRFSRLLDASGAPRYKNTVDISDIEPLLPAMKSIGMHVQLWIEIEQLPSLAPLIRFAGIPFVIDHLGRFDPEQGVGSRSFRIMCDLLKEGCLWVKATPYRSSRRYPDYEDMRPYHEKLLHTNPDRLIWGSDWPHINMVSDIPDAGHLVDLLGHWTADQALLEKILVSNPAALYGFR